MGFSMTIGLSFVSCFSSSDSRTIKFGNVVVKDHYQSRYQGTVAWKVLMKPYIN